HRRGALPHGKGHVRHLPRLRRSDRAGEARSDPLDARLYQLQAEAEPVTPTELANVLREFHRDKLALRQRHVAVARQTPSYDANNPYQYVIAREDVHLSWLEAALAELEAAREEVSEPTLPARGKKESSLPLVTQDSREAEAFVNLWRPRVDDVTNARHRQMMQ